MTNSGRVFCATALGVSISEAQRLAYALANHVHWDGIYYRNDIGYRAIERDYKY
jgi:phosphoribosylamine---glycine ligase